MPDPTPTPGAPRLAELMATLSLASDLTNGAPFEQSLSSAVVAARLAQAAGLSEEQARDAYYLTMPRKVADAGTVAACWRRILAWPARTVMTFHDVVGTAGTAGSTDGQAALKAAVEESGQLNA
jgi:hypothetical protein